MFKKNIPGNKINDLRNDLETDYRILIGEIIIEKLNVEDLYEIVRYGWDRNDLHPYNPMMDLEHFAIECYKHQLPREILIHREVV